MLAAMAISKRGQLVGQSGQVCPLSPITMAADFRNGILEYSEGLIFSPAAFSLGIS